ncbi:MAG TPA: YraN family protein [Puia sp.]|nr:YraN family protein [Puia sp.]
MAAHNEFGKEGEDLAAAWLSQRGFIILERNWKFSRYEIDIIASHTNGLHFIEVKSRHDDRFGFPEDWVDRKKMSHLLRAGVAYQERHPHWKFVQYDILSILITGNGSPDFFFIEDVYCW